MKGLHMRNVMFAVGCVLVGLLAAVAVAAQGAEAADEAAVADGFPSWAKVTRTMSLTDNSGDIDVAPANGLIYATVYSNHEVVVRDLTGAQVNSFPVGRYPQALEIYNDEIYVSVAGENQQNNVVRGRIAVHALDGTFLRNIVEYPAPAQPAPRNFACGFGLSDSKMYVLERFGQVAIFDLDGTLIDRFGSPGSGPGQFNLEVCGSQGVAVWGDEVFVVDTANDRLQVFDLDGNYQRQWGSSGSANGQFLVPKNLDIVKGDVYVLDWVNQRVQVFTIWGSFVGQIPTSSYANFSHVDPGGTILRAGVLVDFNNSPLEVAAETYTTLRCEGFVPDYVGTSYNDDFATGAADDVVHLANGDDTFSAGDGDDRVCGGGGDDVMSGDAGKDRMRGQNGNDILYGGDGNDNLNGNNGNDEVYGGNGHDYVAGKDGEDLVTGGPGTDTINGGGKADTLRGGDGNDTINGNNFGDDIRGGKGNDNIKGGDGNDTIDGETGNDTIEGGRGDDAIDGGEGFDDCNGKTGTDTANSCEVKTNIP